MQHLAEEIAGRINFCRYWSIFRKSETDQEYPFHRQADYCIIDGDTEIDAFIKYIKLYKINVWDLLNLDKPIVEKGYYDTLPNLYEKSDDEIKQVIERLNKEDNTNKWWVIYEYSLGSPVRINGDVTLTLT